MLLLVQNEIGQVMPRALTRSENQVETAALLRTVRDRVCHDGGSRVYVCDNANASRRLVENVFGADVQVKQDPFHVVQRFTEKVRALPKRKAIATALSRTLYDATGSTRSPEEMT